MISIAENADNLAQCSLIELTIATSSFFEHCGPSRLNSTGGQLVCLKKRQGSKIMSRIMSVEL